jgi:sn-glycerol 3-phosphate transport system substrate-binding protein
MDDTQELAGWMAKAVDQISSDVGRADGIIKDAIGRLFASFTELQEHLAQERRVYEEALTAISGTGGQRGIAEAMRALLTRFVEDIVHISHNSVRILSQVDEVRSHADVVTGRCERLERIATTTRTIAFNARIEASRAGAAGRVFRVVADEVRALADESNALSNGIRAALDQQARSLAQAQITIEQLASTDLNVAVEGNRNLAVGLARLENVSHASAAALARLHGDVAAAIQALQFEDMVSQLLASIRGKLGAVRDAATDVAAGRAPVRTILTQAERTLGRDAVSQHRLDAGDVELF